MTQYDLAARVKTTPQNIYKYEKGIVTNIPLENIKRIAEIFGISPVTLVGWEEEEVEKLKTSCSERIDIALKISDMKQADLVRLTGIGKSSISTYISGEYEPKQKNIYKIARALNVNEAWLMGYDVPMEREKPILEQEDGLSENKRQLIELIKTLKEEDVSLLLQLAEKVSAKTEE